MKDERLHTPDGVSDIYNGQCQKKLVLQDKLHQILLKYGYHDIQTPTFEFFNVFGNEIGSTASKDLYKFFDKEGNTLVLRPDFTPSIARSAVKYYDVKEMPTKLCYMGNTFINYTDYKGHLKETTQCGAELMGDGSVFADAELLAMVVDCFKTSGLREFQISVGHAQYVLGLAQAAGLEEEATAELRSLISNKNFFGVEEFVEDLKLSADLKVLFSLLGEFNLSVDKLKEAKGYAKAYPMILESLDRLEELMSYLKLYDIDKYVSIELGVISELQYYTGIIFAGYTFGSGEPIVRGGRYDKLLSYFGQDAPAIGFGIGVDQLINALDRQKIEITVPVNYALLIFRKERYQEAIRRATVLRMQGLRVCSLLFDENKTRQDYIDYATKEAIDRIEFLDGE